MKCSECGSWKPNQKHNYQFGVCKAEGRIEERNISDDLPTNVPLGRYGYREGATRKGNRTRPWHQCDVIRAHS